MKTWKIIAFTIFIIGGYYLVKEDSVQSEETPTIVKPEILDTLVAYDWENDRGITKKMADTMFFSGGHWYSINNPPPLPNKKANSKKPQWIRPAGKDYIYRKSPEMERMWKQQEERTNNQEGLTEDDVRDIIHTEYER